MIDFFKDIFMDLNNFLYPDNKIIKIEEESSLLSSVEYMTGDYDKEFINEYLVIT